MFNGVTASHAARGAAGAAECTTHQSLRRSPGVRLLMRATVGAGTRAGGCRVIGCGTSRGCHAIGCGGQGPSDEILRRASGLARAPACGFREGRLARDEAT